MGWLWSLFSSAETTQYSRKGQALSSTHEAFSLPTSSPTFSHPHPDAFNPDILHTPDLDSPVAYTYPPGSYASRPASMSLLPTHRPPYPPLATTWDRIRTWLNREYPELGDTLNYGILPLDLAQLEIQFGFALPPVIRESYLCCDGQEAESAAGCSEGLFFGLKLLPLEDVLQEWKFWREVDDDPATGANPRLREVMQSIPPGWIRREYSQRGWIPLIADKVGNYVGIDLNPDQSGSVGQVIVFGRDFDTKVVLWRGDGPAGWAKWLASFADELENGESFEIGSGDTSDDSEDELGYESYFYDGTGRGQGDGGGDTGHTGLRLTGEYRGWNVFEAWADRSLRRWHEAGVITDTSLLPLEEEPKETEPEVLNIRHESSVQVGIPILADVDTPIPAPTSVPGSAHPPYSASDSDPLPTISVTRAPLPLPVELPQPLDILPDDTPDSSQSSSFDEEDLESGRSIGMREVAHLVSPRPIHREISTSDASSSRSTSALVAPRSRSILPDAGRSRSSSPRSIASATHAQPKIPDLLEDSAPALDTKPIAPSSPASGSPIPIHALSSESRPVEEGAASAVPDTTNTVRLVGGGGVVGTVNTPKLELELEADADDEGDNDEEEDKIIRGGSIGGGGEGEGEDVASASASSESVANITNGAKTHKKTKNKSSLASLKKFGLGRKRDSKSSLKGVESPVAT